VGTHTITQNTLTAGPNYTITYMPGTLTVLSVNVSITDVKVGGTSADRPGNGSNFFGVAACESNQAVVTVTADSYATVTIGGVTGTSTTLSLPNNGANTFTITVTAQNGNSATYTLTINKPVPFNDMVKTRWNNTLTVINNPANSPGGVTFVSYKWFRGAELIGTDQSWCAGADGRPIPTGVYRVEAVTTGGVTISSCEKTIVASRSMEVVAYPNPVGRGQILSIDADVDDETLQGAVIDVYSITGSRVAQVRVQGRLTTIPVDYITGAYVLVLTGKDGFRKDVKVIVQ
jgi:hypothetical protein